MQKISQPPSPSLCSPCARHTDGGAITIVAMQRLSDSGHCIASLLVPLGAVVFYWDQQKFFNCGANLQLHPRTNMRWSSYVASLLPWTREETPARFCDGLLLMFLHHKVHNNQILNGKWGGCYQEIETNLFLGNDLTESSGSASSCKVP